MPNCTHKTSAETEVDPKKTNDAGFKWSIKQFKATNSSCRSTIAQDIREVGTQFAEVEVQVPIVVEPDNSCLRRNEFLRDILRAPSIAPSTSESFFESTTEESLADEVHDEEQTLYCNDSATRCAESQLPHTRVTRLATSSRRHTAFTVQIDRQLDSAQRDVLSRAIKENVNSIFKVKRRPEEFGKDQTSFLKM